MSKNISKLLLLAALILSAPKRPTNQPNRMSVHAFAHIRRISLDRRLLVTVFPRSTNFAPINMFFEKVDHIEG
jgi:hypothetical protein